LLVVKNITAFYANNKLGGISFNYHEGKNTMRNKKTSGNTASDSPAKVQQVLEDAGATPQLEGKKLNNAHNIKKQALGPNTKR